MLETEISRREKKEQLLDFIGGGIMPSKFLVNMNYNKINQARKIQTINFNQIQKAIKKHLSPGSPSYLKAIKKL